VRPLASKEAISASIMQDSGLTSCPLL